MSGLSLKRKVSESDVLTERRCRRRVDVEEIGQDRQSMRKGRGRKMVLRYRKGVWKQDKGRDVNVISDSLVDVKVGECSKIGCGGWPGKAMAEP